MNSQKRCNSIKKYLFPFLFVLPFTFCFGQQSGGASTCNIAEPICSSSELTFLNTSNGSVAEIGPDYGCLSTQPNPAWFFLQIGNSGNIYLNIYQTNDLLGTPNLDVDFIIYGPFLDVLDACNSGLSSANIVDCSYSPSGIENAEIEGAVSGEFYMLLVTNFSGDSGVITINQSSGTGSTNCAILEGLVACDGDPLELSAQTTGAETYFWYEEDPINPGSYLLIPSENDQVYYPIETNNYKAEVFDIDGGLLNVFEFSVTFLDVPVISSIIEPYIICDNLNENDGVGQFELDSWNEEVLDGLDANTFSVSYFSNEIDAISLENQLPNIYINSSVNETVFVRIDNTNSVLTACYAIETLDLLVLLKPQFTLEDFYLCTFTNGTEAINDPIMDTGLSTMDYLFEWTENNNPNLVLGTDSFYVPTQAGIYSVLVTNRLTGCATTIDNPNTVSVITESSPPDNLTATVVSDAFSTTNSIEANAISDNNTIYEFSLDNGPFQSNGTNTFVFTDVAYGNHTIIARDINGCGEISVSVLVIDYPLIFTPNNDGINDTWQIFGLDNKMEAKIYVFDRFGKLLKQLNPNTIGWDGTFKGKPLPASDYWFSIEYVEPNNLENSRRKEFIAHFTLKR
ncbi:T9SS type B sorting domain-containing protein [Lacinutrix cladophorae]